MTSYGLPGVLARRGGRIFGAGGGELLESLAIRPVQFFDFDRRKEGDKMQCRLLKRHRRRRLGTVAGHGVPSSPPETTRVEGHPGQNGKLSELASSSPPPSRTGRTRPRGRT